MSELALIQRVDLAALLQRNEVSPFAALWLDVAAARRMLAATEGDTELAVRKLIHALKWRDRKRQVLKGDCPLAIDARCIGLDASGSAVLYTCGANQVLHLSPTVDNIIAELERTLSLLDLNGSCGRFVVVLDAFGFDVWKNLELTPLLDLAAALNSYFAERMEQAVVIEMPLAAQYLWIAMSRVLAPKTRAKFKFVGQADGLKIIQERCGCTDAEMCSDVASRVQDIMTLNRLEGKTWESRLATWDSTTWRGSAAHGSVGSNPRRMQRLAGLATMESARAKRLKMCVRPSEEMRADPGKADTMVFGWTCSLLLTVLLCILLLLVVLRYTV